MTYFHLFFIKHLIKSRSLGKSINIKWWKLIFQLHRMIIDIFWYVKKIFYIIYIWIFFTIRYHIYLIGISNCIFGEFRCLQTNNCKASRQDIEKNAFGMIRMLNVKMKSLLFWMLQDVAIGCCIIDHVQYLLYLFQTYLETFGKWCYQSNLKDHNFWKPIFSKLIAEVPF